MTRRRRIDFLVPPYSGHLHPVLAMARLLSVDHEVRVISTPAARDRVRTAGLTFVGVMAGADPILDAIASPPRAVRGNPIRMHGQFQQALSLLTSLSSEITKLYRSDPPDLLIADFTLPTGGLSAQRLGIPWWTSLPSPCVLETPSGPPAYFRGLTLSEGYLGRARNAAARQLVRWFKRGVFFRYRRPLRKAGLQSVYRSDGSEAVYSLERILALGFPQLEFATQWPSAVRFVGPMLYTPTIPAPTPEFREGYRHVLITLGTHIEWQKNVLANAVRHVAPRFPGVMFHFSDGALGQQRALTDGNFSRLSFVNYQQWLPRYDLVLHHAGTGILNYCVANARPAIVFPQDYDQFDYAARLVHAGLAHRLTGVEALEATLSKALNDEQLQIRCKRFKHACDSSKLGPSLLELVNTHFATSDLRC